MTTDALFTPDGPWLVPSPHTRGPWDPRHQHGGPPAALAARAAEQVGGDDGAVARLTLELLRPVPLEPLAVTSTVVRPGRKVQVVGISITTRDDVEVVRGQSLLIRRADLPVGEADGTEGGPFQPGPEAGAEGAFGFEVDEPHFHTTGMEVRAVDGGFASAGPARCWFRLRHPLVAGEALSPTQRVAATADFSNGISWVLPFDEWIYINPDLTLHLAREARGEWIGSDALTVPGPEGFGLAETVLYDRDGRVGRGAQSLYIERRTPGRHT